MKNNEISDEKLRKLLENSNLDQSFMVPSGYFDELPEQVMNSITALPDFDKQAVVQPFEVPANYFESLPSILSEKITTKNRPTFSIWKWIFNPSRAIPIAFSFCILIGGYFYFNRTITVNVTDKNVLSYEDISQSSILQSFDDDDLIDCLASQQEDKTIDEYDQYLLDNNIEISQLEKSL